jgi:hypothetical protein
LAKKKKTLEQRRVEAEAERAKRRFTNRQAVMTCAPGLDAEAIEGTVATDDPCDRWHDIRTSRDGPFGVMSYLVPADDLPPAEGEEGGAGGGGGGRDARARRYHRSYMHEKIVTELRSDGVTKNGAGSNGTGSNGTGSLGHSVTSSLHDRVVGIVSDETVFDETHARMMAVGMRLSDGMGGDSAAASREAALRRLDDVRIRDIVAGLGSEKWTCPCCGRVRVWAWWCEECPPEAVKRAEAAGRNGSDGVTGVRSDEVVTH